MFTWHLLNLLFLLKCLCLDSSSVESAGVPLGIHVLVKKIQSIGMRMVIENHATFNALYTIYECNLVYIHTKKIQLPPFGSYFYTLNSVLILFLSNYNKI